MNHISILRRFMTLFFFIAPLLSAQFTYSSNEKDSKINIGALLPLTGDAASYGVDCRKGMELAIEEYNLKSNRKAVIIFEDTKADPKTAVTVINKLISINNPKIIVGDMFSNTTLAVAPIAQQNGIVLITPTAALEAIPATGDRIFTIYPTSKYEGQYVASYAIEKGLRKFGVIKQQIQVAEEIGDAFSDKIEALKGEIVFSQVVPSGQKDYRSTLEKYKNAHIDALFVSAYRDEAGNIIKQARELGYKNVFLSQSTLYDDKTIKQFGSAVDGVIFSAPYYNDQTESKTIFSFRNKFQKKYNNKPNVWSAYGYDVVRLALQAVDQSEAMKKPLHATLAEIKFDGVTGNMTFFSNRTANKAMQMFKIKNNTFEKITK